MSTTSNTAAMSAIEKMKAAAAAKFAVKTSTVNETPEQAIKNATRIKVAEINTVLAVQILNDYLNANEGIDASTVDMQKTANEHVKALKSALATVSKNLQDMASKGETVDLSVINNFDFYSVDVKVYGAELPPLYKGALLFVDLTRINDEQRQKFASVGITAELTGGICILTSLTFDKSANSIFAKVSGADLAQGSIRVSLRTLQILEDYNTPDVVESFNAKVAELSELIKAPTAKFSEKSFTYMVEFLRKADVSTDIFLIPEGVTINSAHDVANYLEYVLQGLKGEK